MLSALRLLLICSNDTRMWSDFHHAHLVTLRRWTASMSETVTTATSIITAAFMRASITRMWICLTIRYTQIMKCIHQAKCTLDMYDILSNVCNTGHV